MTDSNQQTRTLRVASDVGGTFTDSISYDTRTRRITVAKVPTTPEDRAIGTIDGLRRALAQQNVDGRSVAYVGHGTTTATNAVIQRKGARTAFLTNHGFRDLLTIGRQDRPQLYDIDSLRPLPLVPEERCFTIHGRLDYLGHEIEPLDADALPALARALQDQGVEALAICLLHAYANPAHEQAARDALRTLLPGLVICISSDILREFREYERASTTVLNAFLSPVMDRYLGSLLDRVRDTEAGLQALPDTPVMVIEASGGMMTIQTARSKPVHTVLSGPAGGVVASAHVARLSGLDDLITIDIGGTSTDISLIRNGQTAITRQASLETIPIRIPVIDIHAIGAGGGSIAWIDAGGALRVGPLSAEAIPGPACYGLGGDQPTVTDANLVLGRLGPDTRLGGSLPLDLALARQAIARHIAEPLGLSIEDAASGILRVAHANIVRGVRVVSVERGHDPRTCVLVPFGGAGPLHGTPIARELGIRRILVPPNPGILCALGQLVSDIRHEVIESHVIPYRDLLPAEALAILQRLHQRADALLHDDHIDPADRRFQARVDMRYIGQSYELTLSPDTLTEDGWLALEHAFHDTHAQRFGHASPEKPLQVVAIGIVARGLTTPPELALLDNGDATPAPDALTGRRPVYFESLDALRGGQHLDTPVWRRDRLLAGNVLRGPAIIEEVSATTTLYPGDTATVQSQGSLIVELQHAHI